MVDATKFDRLGLVFLNEVLQCYVEGNYII